MAPLVVRAGGVDVWADLLIACLVVFVVLAPAFFFRLPGDAAEAGASSPKASTPARASIYYHSRGDARAQTVYRRRAEVQQRPSGSREPDLASKRSGAIPPIQKKAL